MNRLFDYDVVEEKENIKVIRDKNGITYSLYKLDKIEYQIYIELSKSKFIKKSIYDYVDNENRYLLFQHSIKKSDNDAIEKDLLNVLENIFNEYKYKKISQKFELNKLNNLYKLLDDKFKYIEMRIRNIEMNPIKDDISWIILSKYYSVLDAKVILYDLQTDIFKFIDKKTTIEYGLVFYSITKDMYENGLIKPNFRFYYCPLGMLYVRYYFTFRNVTNEDYFIKKVEKLSQFDKKYFCFMVLYIYIVNLYLSVNLNYSNINNFIEISKNISGFIKKYNSFLK